MDHIHLLGTPKLSKPVLIAAFAGWNDAAQSATSAVRFLQRRWHAEKFAEIEPDPFFSFTETRPMIRIAEGAVREIEWPTTEFFFHSANNQHSGSDRHNRNSQPGDFVLLLGTEPQLRWRSFIAAIDQICHDFGIESVITLGALLAEVPHTVPPKVIGYSNDPAFAARLGRLDAHPSEYEGPTGIVGVLNAMAGEQKRRTVSIWGSVPTYLSAIPNPRVTLAILQRLDGLLDLTLDLHELHDMSRQFDQQVIEAITSNPQISGYVKQLEDRERGGPLEGAAEPAAPTGPVDLPSGKALVEDIEEFLRQMRNPGAEG